MPPQGGRRGDEEVKEIDPLGLPQLHASQRGQIDQQQRSAAHPRAGEQPGQQSGRRGPDAPGHESIDRMPETSSSAPNSRRSHSTGSFFSHLPARKPPAPPPSR